MENSFTFFDRSWTDGLFTYPRENASRPCTWWDYWLRRELKHKPVGVKTCAIIAVTTCVLTIVSIQAAEHYAQVSDNIRTDPMRLAAQVISGIGFLGAGVILHKKKWCDFRLNHSCHYLGSSGYRCGNRCRLYFWCDYCHFNDFNRYPYQPDCAALCSS